MPGYALELNPIEFCFNALNILVNKKEYKEELCFFLF